MATPVTVSVEAVSNQTSEQPTIAVPPTSQQPPSAIPTIIAAASPPSQPTAPLSTIPGAVSAAPATSNTIIAAPPPPSTMSGALSTVLGPPAPEIKIKEEVEPMDIMRPVSGRLLIKVTAVIPFLGSDGKGFTKANLKLPWTVVQHANHRVAVRVILNNS